MPQPSIRRPDRPDHEGMEVPIAGVHLSGTIGDPRVNPLLHQDDTAIIVAFVRVTRTGFNPTPGGAHLRRNQYVTVEDGFVLREAINVPALHTLRRVLARLRGERQIVVDEINGTLGMLDADGAIPAAIPAAMTDEPDPEDAVDPFLADRNDAPTIDGEWDGRPAGVRDMISRELDRLIHERLVTGDGTGQPTGIAADNEAATPESETALSRAIHHFVQSQTDAARENLAPRRLSLRGDVVVDEAGREVGRVTYGTPPTPVNDRPCPHVWDGPTGQNMPPQIGSYEVRAERMRCMRPYLHSGSHSCVSLRGNGASFSWVPIRAGAPAERCTALASHGLRCQQISAHYGDHMVTSFEGGDVVTFAWHQQDAPVQDAVDGEPAF